MVALNLDWDELEDNIDEEYDDSGNTIAEYTTEPYLYGDLISQRRDGQSRFHCFDGQGSSLALTDSVGTVTDTTAYTAFGEVTQRTGTTGYPFQFVGQKGYHRDSETMDDEVRHRRLSSDDGRWQSADGRDTDTMNVYLYVANRPTYSDDPSGLLPSLPDINWPELYKQIQDLVTKLIDAEVQRAIGDVDQGLDAILGIAALAAFNTKCFKLTVALKSAKTTATGTTSPAALPWSKRVLCSAIASSFRLLTDQLAVPRVMKQFPRTRFKDCPPGKVCDNKWTPFAIPVPVLTIPLGTQSIPLAVTTTPGRIPIPIVTETCNVPLSLVITPTSTAFIANCVACKPVPMGIRPIDPIFMP